MGRKPGQSYQPRAGETFNVIMSIQYRGWKEAQFSKLLFSSAAGVTRAIDFLKLKKDFSRLRLPVSSDRVSRSSYGYPNTIEILYLECEGGGVSVYASRV